MPLQIDEYLSGDLDDTQDQRQAWASIAVDGEEVAALRDYEDEPERANLAADFEWFYRLGAVIAEAYEQGFRDCDLRNERLCQYDRHPNAIGRVG